LITITLVEFNLIYHRHVVFSVIISIQTEIWTEVFRENDVVKKWDSFYSIFNYYFNVACPKVRTNIASALKVPWINKDAVIARTN
jgi:hypothetical protein